MDEFFAMMDALHSPRGGGTLPSTDFSRFIVTPKGPQKDAFSNSEVVYIDKEEATPLERKRKDMDVVSGSSKKFKSSRTPFETHLQLQIAKHNFSIDEKAKGNVEVKALRTWFMDNQMVLFEGSTLARLLLLKPRPLSKTLIDQGYVVVAQGGIILRCSRSSRRLRSKERYLVTKSWWRRHYGNMTKRL
uniref:Uncharacterized protein n=1 Tax=Cannabis sativa TaxID=3483 RepID=A0A803NMN2_CANSA